jgi:hypothetical protein
VRARPAAGPSGSSTTLADNAYCVDGQGQPADTWWQSHSLAGPHCCAVNRSTSCYMAALVLDHTTAHRDTPAAWDHVEPVALSSAAPAGPHPPMSCCSSGRRCWWCARTSTLRGRLALLLLLRPPASPRPCGTSPAPPPRPPPAAAIGAAPAVPAAAAQPAPALPAAAAEA